MAQVLVSRQKDTIWINTDIIEYWFEEDGIVYVKTILNEVAHSTEEDVDVWKFKMGIISWNELKIIFGNNEVDLKSIAFEVDLSTKDSKYIEEIRSL